ncbi:MAG: type IV toxin-antitoxin system AbiEi family antitoxin [Planctomycetia bacterium]|nr:type IV toxin-antitoxin system AbiEi family antitoxin [Planctomycetia bacterium]
MASATLEKWVDRLQARGKYTFLRSEAQADSGLSPEAGKKALQRLAARGRIAKAKDYFFVIVPLEYSTAGGPPPSWFIHDLMVAMNRPYYVGLLTAAGLHGASHQQPQEFQVVTDRPVRPIAVGRARIRFFVSKFVVGAPLAIVKTPTGTMRVSSSEMTAVDLVRYATAAGGLDNVATVIGEMSTTLDPKRLLAAVKFVSDVPNAQRLGYILEHVGAASLARSLREWIERRSPRPVALRSGRPTANALENRRWRLLVDEPLEVEA